MPGLTPGAGAMIQGMDEGQQQAQSILPSTFQPQGKAKPDNPWAGTLDSVVDTLLSCADGVSKQGDKYRAEKDKLLKLAYEVAKCNSALTDIAEKGSENANY